MLLLPHDDHHHSNEVHHHEGEPIDEDGDLPIRAGDISPV
jgi:hypothetical protein